MCGTHHLATASGKKRQRKDQSEGKAKKWTQNLLNIHFRCAFDPVYGIRAHLVTEQRYNEKIIPKLQRLR
jgi:hypothetical protein